MRLASKQKKIFAALHHLAVVGVVALIVFGTYTAAAGPTGRFDRRAHALRARLATAAPTDEVQITVVLREPEARGSRAERRGRVRDKQNSTLARLTRSKFTLKNRYRWLSGFSGWADAETIAMLNADPNVLRVDVDRVAYVAGSEGTALVGADTVQALGVTGSGVAIAMLDTGIDSDHPNLSSSLVAEACFCDDQPGPAGCCPDGTDNQTGPGSAEDDQGHGTGTTGVIVSSSGSHLGIAPGADIVALKVLDANGTGLFSDIADALDWVIGNHETYGIKVVNLSLSDGGEYNNAAASPCSGTNTGNAIADLKTLGISVYTASGNEGHDSGISFPACVPDAISVGGVYDASFPSVNWSNPSGTTLCTDTPAPVDSFVCHSNSGALLDLLAPDYLTSTTGMGGGTGHFGGTSIASPYAAGQAALLLEAVPTLTPDEIVSWLKFFAPQVTNPDNGLSFSRTRVDVAVQFLLAVCGNGIMEVGESCDDGNTVSGDCCDSACSFEISGSSCDDVDMCTTTDTCDGAGMCVGSGALSCDDLNACTNDSCIPATGCDFAPNTAACDDSNACTNGDICAAGSCVPGAPIVCDDANLCTNDSCIPATGCDFASNTAACDDSDACTNGDICAAGSCVSGSMLDCDDADACTADACDEVTGCSNSPIVGCSGAPLVPSFGPLGFVLLIGLLAFTSVVVIRMNPAARPGR